MDFLKLTIFDSDSITTKAIYEDVYHSHITGEIYGFTHDFCNWKVRESKQKFTFFTQNLFSCNSYFSQGILFKCIGNKTFLVLADRI